MKSAKARENKTGYFRGVRSEMRKVTWPSKKELINYTIVVLVMVIFCAAVIGLMDFVFKRLFMLLT